MVETGHVTVSVSFLIIAASLYTRMLALSGVPQYLVGEIAGAGLGPYGFLACYILLVVIMGCFIDSSSILLIVLPLMLPIASGFAMNLIRSEEHTSELQSLMRISYAVFCLKKQTHTTN